MAATMPESVSSGPRSACPWTRRILRRSATCSIPRSAATESTKRLLMFPLTCKYDHRETESKENMSSTSSVSSVQFPAEFVSELKRRVPYRCTTFECLLAHVWKKIVVARGHGHDERTRIRIAAAVINDGRGNRMRPVVPIDVYSGNNLQACWALPTSRVGEVVSNDIGANVGTIRKAVKQLGDDYFRSFIDFGGILNDDDEEEELMVSTAEDIPDLEVASWLGFPVDDIKAILSPDNIPPVEGIITFVDDSLADGEKGGVNVYTTLRREHADKFNSICFSLD